MYLYRKDIEGDQAVKVGRELLIVYFVACLANFTSVVHVFS